VKKPIANHSVVESRSQRLELIRAIEQARDSHVIAYVTGDRPGATVQIGEDAVRPMYEHVRSLGFDGVQRIDLFLYSRGGAVEVPWRIVSMLREYCKEFNVLVPYKAHSAATLIALGADHIVMGKKGELGPIDPSLGRTERGERQEVNVEDIMAYVAFIKERAGLGDQAALSGSINALAQQLTPSLLGTVYRTYSHIRLVARKLILSRQPPLDEQRVNLIVESLAEKIYSHGHAIGRREAGDIGLPIEVPGADIETAMWGLYEAYEEMMELDSPIDPRSIIPNGQEKGSTPVIMACIESNSRIDAFTSDLRFEHIRQMPQTLNLNVNANLQLPPTVTPDSVPEAAQAAVQQMLQGVQQQIRALVQMELQKQAPIQRTEGSLVEAAWRQIAIETA